VPRIIGIARRKEKSIAAFRLNPRSMPATMVIPLRDVPGTSAIAWAMPINSAIG